MNQSQTSAKKAAVLGAGSWGTALAQLLGRKGLTVTMWAREPEVVQSINEKHENDIFLPDIPLSENITASGDVQAVVDNVDLVLCVIPTQFLRSFLVSNREVFPPGVPFVSCSKGIENISLMTPMEIMLDELPGKYHKYLAVLSGPSFAKEVGLGWPTNVTVAAKDIEVAASVQDMVSDFYFRVYTSDDTVGVEMGGASKNVIAIAAGGSDGVGFGHNARAGLITRGLAEITRLAVKKGGNPLTLAGLSGMGDLVLTCTGDLSRNRQVGYRLAQGEGIDDIITSMRMVAEGVKTAKSMYNLSRKIDVDMPICDQVYAALYDAKPIDEVISTLLGRPLGPEIRG